MRLCNVFLLVFIRGNNAMVKDGRSLTRQRRASGSVVYESSFFKNSSFLRVETSISELSLISTNPPFPLL